MKILQRQISLEPMTSRLPSIWPAYLDNELYYFDEEFLKSKQYQHTSNYGMVPLNVTVPKDMVPLFEELEKENKRLIEKGEEPKCIMLSWYTLSNWYYFFTEYYNLLKQYGHCNRVYTSAEDYYNYESSDKFASQMIYGSDKQTYIDLDNEFREKGGIVKVKVYYKIDNTYSGWIDPDEAHDEHSGDETIIVDVTDYGFFKWICENVVPSFEIPMDYVDFWNAKKMYYPDVVKWLAWFNDRNEKYSGVTDCNNSGVTDCCECEEYKNRGGYDMFSSMSEWYDAITENIQKNNSDISGCTESSGCCLNPYMTLPINLQACLDDLGEFSIFSKEYDVNTDYRTIETESGSSASTIYYESGNTHPGTVVTMEDGSSSILVSGSGFTFVPCYMEKTKDEDAWSSYTDRYVSSKENEDDFKIGIKYYTFDINNVKYTSSADTVNDAKDCLKKQMSREYEMKDIDGYLINGILYEAKKTEYAETDNGKKYVIQRDRITNTPYVYINGNEVYAEYHQPSNKFYFTYFKKEGANIDRNVFDINNYWTFDRFNTGKTTMKYIEYDGRVLTEDNINGFNGWFEGYQIIKVLGYAVNDDNVTMYRTNDGRILTTDLEELENYMVDDEKKHIIAPYDYPFTIYAVNEVTGRTISKLSDLVSYNRLIDDIGNEIDGIYTMTSATTRHQPDEGKELEPLYQVGNTANIRRFSKTQEDVNNGINYFVGDIITRMKFYYKDVTGEIVEDTIIDIVLNGNNTNIKDSKGALIESYKSINYTSLDGISAATIVRDNIESGSGNCNGDIYTENENGLEVNDDYTCITFMDDIFCDITYNKGATLSRTEGENFMLAEGMNHGVEYSETVRFVKENREYYLKKPKKVDLLAPFKRNRPDSHSISYPIYVYKMTQELTGVENSQYGSYYSVPMAEFKFNILTYYTSGTEEDMEVHYTSEKEDDMEAHNGSEAYPTFREEYRLGSSTIENVDVDIYIERGINAAYERHLKLGEVTSLEALEQYGNNFFKMMDS